MTKPSFILSPTQQNNLRYNQSQLKSSGWDVVPKAAWPVDRNMLAGGKDNQKCPPVACCQPMALEHLSNTLRPQKKVTKAPMLPN